MNYLFHLFFILSLIKTCISPPPSVHCLVGCTTCLPNLTCTACDPGYYLINGACSLQCNGGFGYPSSGNVCISCYSGCNSCQISSNICTSCINGEYLLGYTCVSSCPITYYENSNINTCSNCPTTCASCTSMLICQNCISTAFFLGNMCYTNCPAAYY